MGVKAIYIWAAMLVPTTVLLWLFYPEVSSQSLLSWYPSLRFRHMVEHTGKSTSFMSAGSLLGDSRALKRWPSSRDCMVRRLAMCVYMGYTTHRKVVENWR